MQTLLRAGVVLVALLAAAGARGEDVGTLLDPYFRIHAALVEDRTDGVARDAELIATEAKALGNDGREIATAASALASATGLEATREAFGRLSEALIGWAEEAGADLGAGVSTMYCPMVNKSWVQKGDAVKNPYYGPAMLACGEKKKPSN